MLPTAVSYEVLGGHFLSIANLIDETERLQQKIDSDSNDISGAIYSLQECITKNLLTIEMKMPPDRSRSPVRVDDLMQLEVVKRQLNQVLDEIRKQLKATYTSALFDMRVGLDTAKEKLNSVTLVSSIQMLILALILWRVC